MSTSCLCKYRPSCAVHHPQHAHLNGLAHAELCLPHVPVVNCSTSPLPLPLPQAAEQAKKAGNHAFFERNYAAAVMHYSAALRHAPAALAGAVLSSRAAALLERRWEGDAWFALQVCAAHGRSQAALCQAALASCACLACMHAVSGWESSLSKKIQQVCLPPECNKVLWPCTEL